jgi:hypothetical protein
MPKNMTFFALYECVSYILRGCLQKTGADLTESIEIIIAVI